MTEATKSRRWTRVPDDGLCRNWLIVFFFAFTGKEALFIYHKLYVQLSFYFHF